MTRFYPVSLALEGRRSVVIGGGRIATDKVKGLLEAGARVTVIAPELSPALEALVESGAVAVERRAYRPGDLAGAFLAIAATDDRDANRQVWGEAEARGVLLNAVDDVDHCHFIAPAIHRRGDLTVSVSTGGKSPAVAARLRDRIAESIGPEYAPWLELLGALRDEIARRVPDAERRREVWYRIADSEARVLLARGDLAGARGRINSIVANAERRSTASRQGSVYLVGAGPGDPDLITSRGLALLRAAEVVVYDRLIDERMLAEAPPWAERISVTDGGADAEQRQGWVNQTLTERARAGFTVVRLKGGDPFVFGRGGEEIVALRAAGIRYHVVPGVTAAVAAPGAAEIPVTHRDFSSGFAVITAHARDGAELAADWDALARVPTVVVLMGLSALSRVSEKLIAAGRSPETPAAVVSRATRRDARTVLGTLATIAGAATAAHLAAPATLIIGDVVRLAPNADQLIGSPATLIATRENL